MNLGVVQGGRPGDVPDSMEDQTVNYHWAGGGVKFGVTINKIRFVSAIEPQGYVGVAEIHEHEIWVGLGPPQDNPQIEEWYQLTDAMVEAVVA